MNPSKIIAVACETADGLAAAVCGHFGHAPFFVVAEIADRQVTASRTVASPAQGGGRATANFVHGLGATAVIVGGVGGGAMNGLAARGIEVIAGVSGNAGEVLKSYAAGRLISGDPDCHGHHGGHDEGEHGGHGHHHGGCGGGHHHN
jgi:predicted Fe-Mo cluster-binding NifX family protein